MKKSDNSRSHSWWWDSHISPKNSKWLHENLSEMDLKVNAMLKIIEEDADSFAKRAEMYYERRPQLLNLVEEFYRTYRALVERHNFLTREIHQNIAPALQAQLGVSGDSAQSSPIDLHLKHSMDGFDIISPSYSYTGGLEYDDDSQSEVSSRSGKGHMDEEESSPHCVGSNIGTQSFGFKPKCPSLQADQIHKGPVPGGLNSALDMNVEQLHKNFQHLQEENKVIVAKASEDAAHMKQLQLELSSLQSKMRTLEAEDKLAKNRLKLVLEQEQKLEARNLKLSHTLITIKEENTELFEMRNRDMEENKAARTRIQQMEEEALKEEIMKAQSAASVGQERVKMFEKEDQLLQQALLTSQEGIERQPLDQKETFEQHMRELQVKICNQEQNRVLERDRSTAVAKSQELLNEVQAARKDGQNLSDQIAQKVELIVELEGAIQETQVKIKRLEIAQMEGSKCVQKLEADIQELGRNRDRLAGKCQQYEGKCKALEETEAQLKEQLASLSSENDVLQNEKSATEDMVSKAALQVDKLQQTLSALYSEKATLVHELEKASERVKTAEAHCRQMHEEVEQTQKQRDDFKQGLADQFAHITQLEGTLNCLLQEKNTMEKREAEARQMILELRKENSRLGGELVVECVLTKHLKDKISDLENEKTALVLDIQQAQQRLANLQGENNALSDQYKRSRVDHQTTEEAARKAQEVLSFQSSEIKQLQDQTNAQTGLLGKFEDEIGILQKQLVKSLEENKVMGKENKDYINKIVDFEARMKGLESRLSDSIAASTQLADQLSAKAKTIKLLEDELSELHGENIALHVEIILKSEHSNLLQKEILTLKEQDKSLHVMVKKGADMILSLEAGLERLQHAVSKAEEEKETLVQEWKKTVDENLIIKKKVEDVQEELTYLTEDKMLLVSAMSTCTEQCQQLEQRIQVLQDEKDDVQKQLSGVLFVETQLKEEVRNLHEVNQQISSSLDAEDKVLQKQEDDLQTLQQALSSSRDEQNAILDRLKLAAKEKDNLEAKLIESNQAALAALDNVKKHEAELDQLLRENAVMKADFSWKAKEISMLQCDILKLQVGNKESEDKLQEGENKMKLLEEESERLRGVLAAAQQENKRLHELLSKVTADCKDAQTALVESRRELNKQIAEIAKLKTEMATKSTTTMELKQEVAQIQEEKESLCTALETLRQEMRHLQGDQEQSLMKISAEICQMQEKDVDIQKLHKQFQSVETHNICLTDHLFRVEADYGAAEERLAQLQEELAWLKSEDVRHRNDLLFQHSSVSELEEKVCRLQVERTDLKEDNALASKQMLDMQREVAFLQEQNEGWRKQLEEKDKEVLKLKTKAEQLQQSLLSLQHGSANLRQHLSKQIKSQNSVEEKLKNEIYCLQCEEGKWKSDMATKDERINELHEAISTLKVQKEVLDAHIAVNAELGLVLQKKAKSLSKEHHKVTQKLHFDLQTFQEAEMNELQDALIKLEIKDTALHQKWAAETALLENQISELTHKLSNLQQENAALKSELASQFLKLKDVEVAVCTEKAEKVELAENIHLQERQASKLQQSIVKAKEENEDLVKRVQISATEVHKLKTQIQNLQLEIENMSEQHQRLLDNHNATVVEIEQLQNELAVAREENSSLREAISVEVASALDLRKELSNFQHDKTDLEEALKSQNAQMKELQVVINDLQNTKETLLLDVQHQHKHEFQIIAEINELIQLLLDNRNMHLRASREGCNEQLLETPNNEISHIRGVEIQSLDLAKQPPTSRCENKARETKAVASASNLQDESVTPAACKNIVEGTDFSYESNQFVLKGAVAAWKDVIAKLKEEIDDLLEENDLLKNKFLKARMEQSFIENTVKGLQDELSYLKAENEHLNLRVNTSRTKTVRLEEELSILEGHERGLKDKVDGADAEVRKLQRILSKFQEEGTKSTMSLKATLFALREEIESEIEKWQKLITKKEDTQVMEVSENMCCMHRASSNSNSEISTTAERMMRMEQQGEEHGSTETVEEVWVEDRTNLHEETRRVEGGGMFLLGQLRARLEEGKMLLKGVCDLRQMLVMLQKEEGELQDPLASVPQEEQHETVESAPLEKILEIAEGSARLHVNLGTRLHQEAMDEKLEYELLELKEGRKQLEEDLKTRMEQVKRVEAEVEKLQRLVKEEDVDPRKQRKKKKVEEAARQLMAEVALHKQRIEEAAQQQEQEEQRLEKQVLAGWRDDEEKAERVREEMGGAIRAMMHEKQGLGSMGADLERLGALVGSMLTSSRSGWWSFFWRRPPTPQRNALRCCLPSTYKLIPDI